MNFIIKNSFLISKKIKKILIRDLLKSPVINYFGDNHPKNALISYITKPLKKGIDLSHTNSAEVLGIANIFRSLGFNIDVADYDFEGFLDYNKYDVIFGFGEPLVNSFSYKKENDLVRIYYGTGMHVSVQNNNSLKRIEEVYKKKGVWLIESGRIVEKAWSQQTNIVDAMIVLGNDIVKESYEKYFDKDIYMVSPSFYKIYDYKEIIENKDFKEARNNFLWFGSSGLIHKGLDLLLDLFKTIPDIQLHICGPLDGEQGFKEIYNNELYNTPNIHPYGFIKIDSHLFKELIKKCAFVIYPSCSEGGSPAVLNVSGNGGLIPVLSKEASIDVNGFGFIIKSLSIEEIKNSIGKARLLNDEEMKRKSLSWAKYLTEENCLDSFSKSIKKHLQIIFQKNDL
jgi:hypothetical protein